MLLRIKFDGICSCKLLKCFFFLVKKLNRQANTNPVWPTHHACAQPVLLFPIQLTTFLVCGAANKEVPNRCASLVRTEFPFSFVPPSTLTLPTRLPFIPPFAPPPPHPFYRALLSAWREVNGARTPVAVPVLSLLRCLSIILVLWSMSLPSMSTSFFRLSTALRLTVLRSSVLSMVNCTGPPLGASFLPSTWIALSTTHDAHDVLYTADWLIGRLIRAVSVVRPPSVLSLAHSVLSCLLSLMFSYSSSCPSLVCRYVLFGFAPSELHSLPKVLVYMLNVCKFFVWHARQGPLSGPVPSPALVQPCVLSPLGVGTFSIVGGVLRASLSRLSMIASFCPLSSRSITLCLHSCAALFPLACLPFACFVIARLCPVVLAAYWWRTCVCRMSLFD